MRFSDDEGPRALTCSGMSYVKPCGEKDELDPPYCEPAYWCRQSRKLSNRKVKPSGSAVDRKAAAR